MLEGGLEVFGGGVVYFWYAEECCLWLECWVEQGEGGWGAIGWEQQQWGVLH